MKLGYYTFDTLYATGYNKGVRGTRELTRPSTRQTGDTNEVLYTSVLESLDSVE